MYCGREADLERDIGSILDAGSAGVVVMSDAKGMLDAGCWMLDAGCWMLVVPVLLLDAAVGFRAAFQPPPQQHRNCQSFNVNLNVERYSHSARYPSKTGTTQYPASSIEYHSQQTPTPAFQPHYPAKPALPSIQRPASLCTRSHSNTGPASLYPYSTNSVSPLAPLSRFFGVSLCSSETL